MTFKSNFYPQSSYKRELPPHRPACSTLLSLHKRVWFPHKTVANTLNTSVNCGIGLLPSVICTYFGAQPNVLFFKKNPLLCAKKKRTVTCFTVLHDLLLAAASFSFGICRWMRTFHITWSNLHRVHLRTSSSFVKNGLNPFEHEEKREGGEDWKAPLFF